MLVKMFNTMGNKSKIIQKYHDLISHELSKIKKEVLYTNFSKRKAEDIAEKFYTRKGYTVLRSKVKDGYRIIGVEFYWREYKDKLTSKDKKMVSIIKSVTSSQEFKELAYLFRDKNGCPDLMLIKKGSIKFVEVKSNNEEVKTPTIEFFIKLNNKYDLEILRIKSKN